jgi:hypothetical protein
MFRLGDGVVGRIARDPGDDRWLWSVRWAGRAPYYDAGQHYREGRPALERRGKASSRDAALDCLSLAVVEGRPDA